VKFFRVLNVLGLLDFLSFSNFNVFMWFKNVRPLDVLEASKSLNLKPHIPEYFRNFGNHKKLTFQNSKNSKKQFKHPPKN